jgi:hypothetical protein
MADALKNVHISVLKYVDTNLGTYAIDWPGARFDSTAQDEWIEPRLIGPTNRATRKSRRDEDWIVNVNVYVRETKLESDIYRAEEIADDVRDALHQAEIEIQDWQSMGDPTVEFMRLSEVDVTPVPRTGARTPETGELKQLNVSATGTLIVGA